MMTCHDVQPRLSDYVDHHLDAAPAMEMRAHLTTCPECRGLADDLGRLRGAARALGSVPPPPHIWLEIAGRVRLEGNDGNAGDAGDASNGRATHTPIPAADRAPTATWQWLGLAAALVLVTLGVYAIAQPDTLTPTAVVDSAPGNSTNAPTVETVEETMRRAEAEYEKAIVQLEQVLRSGDPKVSAAAGATLQKSLTTIDTAIAETRVALTSNPDSRPARVSLFEALRNKVNLLQHTVVLMNEMRKGDASGTAEAAAGLGANGRGTS